VTVLGLSRRPFKFIKTFAISPYIAMLPTISHMYGEKDFNKLKEVIIETTIVFIIIFLLISEGVILFNNSFITLWVGQKFYIGNFINSIIAMTFFFSSFAYIISNFTFSLGAIKQNSLFQFIKDILQLLTMYFAGLLWGLSGILVGALVVSLISETWYYPKLLSLRIRFSYNDIKKNVFRLVLIFVSTIALSYGFYFKMINSWKEFFITATLFSLSFFIIVNLLYRDYKKLIKQIIKR